MKRTASAGLAALILMAGLVHAPQSAGAQDTRPVRIAIGDVTVVESRYDAVRVRLPITLSRPLDDHLVVRITTADGTAEGGTDFVPLVNQKVRIHRGKTSPGLSGSVWVLPDQLSGPSESFTVSIDSTNNPDVVIETGVGRIQINDALPVTTPARVHGGRIDVFEGDTGTARVHVPIVLSQPQPTETIVYYEAILDEDEFDDFGLPDVKRRKVRIPAGRTHATLPVDVHADEQFDGTKWSGVPEVLGIRITRTNRPITVVPTSFAAHGGIAILIDDDPAPPLPGTLWGWGRNDAVQLGQGSALYRGGPDELEPIPVLIDPSSPQPADARWAEIDTGSLTTKALQTDGGLWVWGRAPFANPTFYTPATMPYWESWRLRQIDDDGLGMLISEDGLLSLYPTPPPPYLLGMNPPENAGWAFVDGTGNSLIAIKEDGTMWHWANGYTGLPVQVPGSAWRYVSATDTYSTSGYRYTALAIKADGTLWAWGQNDRGQLGLDDLDPRTTPTQVGSDTDWAEVATNGTHVIARRTDGSLWAWGHNDRGQLGLGDTDDRLLPTRIGDRDGWVDFDTEGGHVVAIHEDGSMWGWGANEHGQLGLGDRVDRWSPTRVGSENNWGKVSTGPHHTLAIRR